MTKSTQSNISYLIDQQYIVLALQGELRFLDSAWLENAFSLVYEQWEDQNRAPKVVIDLTEAIFIDSTMYGLIALYLVRHEKLAGSQIVVYHDSDDIRKELLSLRMDELCLLESAVPPYGAQQSEFVAIEKSSVIKRQLEKNVCKSHKALADLTNNPAMQSVIDSISKPNKGH